jgi:hypothetical protein
VVVERLDELGLIPAPQHPHAPRPIIEDRFQVFGSIRWRKRRPSTASATATLALRRSSASTLGCSGLGCALSALALGMSGLYLADRDKKNEHTCRERLSIKHG